MIGNDVGCPQDYIYTEHCHRSANLSLLFHADEIKLSN
jgi:hypothetical protein